MSNDEPNTNVILSEPVQVCEMTILRHQHAKFGLDSTQEITLKQCCKPGISDGGDMIFLKVSVKKVRDACVAHDFTHENLSRGLKCWRHRGMRFVDHGLSLFARCSGEVVERSNNRHPAPRKEGNTIEHVFAGDHRRIGQRIVSRIYNRMAASSTPRQKTA
ncbi:MAG: hypothetical protein AAFZ01_01980 [Pseudomonadota bacterium]